MNTINFININECKPGMKIAENIFNNYGAVVVAQDSILDERVIDKLKLLNITKIKIYMISNERMKKNTIIKQKYDTQVNAVKDVIKDISSGQNLDIVKVEGVVNILMDMVQENKDVAYCINQVRDADEYTYTHSVNVSLLSMAIARRLGFKENKVRELVYAGLLHDIGKAKIDLAILNKPAKLTDEEYTEMKKHPLYGYQMLQTMPDISKDVSLGVLMHHEREDGSGYTLGAKSEHIHEYGKIVAVADVYDAMTANRVYRPKICPFDVFEHIQKEASNGKLNAKITVNFLNLIAEYYIGDKCRLSDGQIGEITFINPNNISKPLVKVDNEYIYLSNQSDIKILEII